VSKSDQPGMSRRRLLGGAALASGMAAASMALPPNVRKALAEPAPKSFHPQDIKHVVLLMQENRSFGHYFGTLPGVRGFGDPTAIELPIGNVPSPLTVRQSRCARP
jgi:phospholipase C